MILLILFTANDLKSQDDSLRVLFVGNSYTYFWNMPQLMTAMAHSQGIKLMSRQSTAGGVSWKQHWNGDKNLQTISLIKQGHWDIVVLQDHSLGSVNNIDEFIEYGQKLAQLVRDQGAEPLFFMTWPRQGNPLMQEAISDGYQKLAELTNSEVLAIGPAWMQARQLMPELALYDQDGHHPAPAGAYLTAALFLKKLSNRSVLEIPPRLTTIDHRGEKTYLSIMPPEEAKFILQLVEKFDTKQEESER